jgi:hypothetical protein
MKAIATLLLSLTLPGAYAPNKPQPQPVETSVAQRAHKGGVWYFADNGHAVYCYGPVMYVRDEQGSLSRVATFCNGDKPIVPLKD